MAPVDRNSLVAKPSQAGRGVWGQREQEVLTPLSGSGFAADESTFPEGGG